MKLVIAVSAVVTALTGAVVAAAPPFVDRTSATGLDFVHFNGMSGELYFAEMMGAGAALLDYDGDGDLDALLLQGRMLGDGKELGAAVFPPRHPLPLTHRLYRNDLAAGPGGAVAARFIDVTAASGLPAGDYGMGIAAGDYDNDGWTDLYLANFGPNRLLRNRGDGTFEDATARAGVGDPRWSVPAVFFDYDRDGWLDLFVGNYVDFRIATHKPCSSPTGARDYCSPQSFAPEGNRLFRNRGDGTFEDTTAKSGLGAVSGPALGAVAGDFDRDGWLDLYVANDGEPNQMWLNRRDGTFADGALLAGTAVNEEGQPEASMGVLAEDLTGDGAEDLFLTHLTRETNTLYVNHGAGLFEDRTQESGVGAPSWLQTGFGTAAVDYDADGRLDLFVANGAVTLIDEQVRAGDPHPLHQRNQLFHNEGAGRFREVGGEGGPALAPSEVSRGVAMGDVDGDGDSDLLVNNNAGPARLLVNQGADGRPWLGGRAVGRGGRDLLGTLLGVEAPGRPPLSRRMRTDGSYASAGDPRVVFGLGGEEGPLTVHVVWPDGRASALHGLAPRRYYVLRVPGGARQ